MTARKARRFGRKDRDKPEAPDEVGQAAEEYLRDEEAVPRGDDAAAASAAAQPLRGSRPRPLEEGGVHQRPDTHTDGMAERWRASHEVWRQRMRSQRR